jgi:hypothetical protein
MGDEPSMPDRPRRRSFTADYKLTILDEYDRCAGDGDKGALLRREDLYTSHIVEWRRARDCGALAGLGSKDRLPKHNPLADELARKKSEPGLSSRRRDWWWRSREKHRSSWGGCSPRATRRTGSSGDRPSLL